VEEKYLEISLPRMPGGKLTRRNAGPPPSGLWARDILGRGGLSSPDEGFPLDGGRVESNSSVEYLSHSIPPFFHDPAAQLMNDMLEAMGIAYRH
jgi:hypothetical protein